MVGLIKIQEITHPGRRVSILGWEPGRARPLIVFAVRVCLIGGATSIGMSLTQPLSVDGQVSARARYASHAPMRIRKSLSDSGATLTRT